MQQKLIFLLLGVNVMKKSAPVPIGIVGASGYGGVQLVKLLQDHPKVEVAYLSLIHI